MTKDEVLLLLGKLEIAYCIMKEQKRFIDFNMVESHKAIDKAIKIIKSNIKDIKDSLIFLISKEEMKGYIQDYSTIYIDLKAFMIENLTKIQEKGENEISN